MSENTVPSEFQSLSEGKATVLFPKTDVDVFYNPVQELNRDLSIQIIGHYLTTAQTTAKQPYKPLVVEALAASGLRSIRYALELPQDVDFTVIANDVSPSAVEAVNRNVEFNKTTRPSPRRRMPSSCCTATRQSPSNRTSSTSSRMALRPSSLTWRSLPSGTAACCV